MNKKIAFLALILPLVVPLTSNAQATTTMPTQYNYTQDGATSPLFGQTNFPTAQSQVGQVVQPVQQLPQVQPVQPMPVTQTQLASSSNPYSQNMAYGQIFFDSIYMVKSNLSKGSAGDAVVALQTFLQDNAYLLIPAGTPKGYFGDLTKLALTRFQQSRSIPATGVFDAATRTALLQFAASKGVSL